MFEFIKLLFHWFLPTRWSTTADSVSLADDELVFAAINDFTFLDRLVYPSCLSVLVNDKSADIDEVNRRRDGTGAPLCSLPSTARRWDPERASRKNFEAKKDYQEDGDDNGDDEDLLTLIILSVTMIKM